LKKLISLFAIFFVLVAVVFSGENQQVEAKKFYRLGLAPLVKDGIFKSDGVRNVFSKKPKMTKENEAVYLLLSDGQLIKGGLVSAFFEQISIVDILTISVEVGETIEKMAFLSKSGEVKITGKLEWAGLKPFEALAFRIAFDRQSYWFLIPKTCGNISLWKIEDEELVEASEDRIPEEVFTSPPPKFKARPILKYGPRLGKTEKSKKYEYLIDAYVAEFQGCGNKYVGSRIGIVRPVEENFKIFATGGAAFPIYAKDGKWKTVFMADFGAVYLMEKFSVGAGIGFSTKIREDKDDQLEGLVNASLKISKKTNVFFEYRFPVREAKEDEGFIKAHRKFIGGIRITF